MRLRLCVFGLAFMCLGVFDFVRGGYMGLQYKPSIASRVVLYIAICSILCVVLGIILGGIPRKVQSIILGVPYPCIVVILVGVAVAIQYCRVSFPRRRRHQPPLPHPTSRVITGGCETNCCTKCKIHAVNTLAVVLNSILWLPTMCACCYWEKCWTRDRNSDCAMTQRCYAISMCYKDCVRIDPNEIQPTTAPAAVDGVIAPAAVDGVILGPNSNVLPRANNDIVTGRECPWTPYYVAEVNEFKTPPTSPPHEPETPEPATPPPESGADSKHLLFPTEDTVRASNTTQSVSPPDVGCGSNTHGVDNSDGVSVDSGNISHSDNTSGTGPGSPDHVSLSPRSNADPENDMSFSHDASSVTSATRLQSSTSTNSAVSGSLVGWASSNVHTELSESDDGSESNDMVSEHNSSGRSANDS